MALRPMTYASAAGGIAASVTSTRKCQSQLKRMDMHMETLSPDIVLLISFRRARFSQAAILRFSSDLLHPSMYIASPA